MTAINPGSPTALYGKDGEAKYKIAPETSAAQTLINDADGNASTVETEIEVLRAHIASIENGGVTFKGSLTKEQGLPTVAYRAGWQYAVKDAGTYAGQVCEEGDMVLCIKDYASGSAGDADWTVIQANVVGAVTGPDAAIAGHVAVFDGTSGKIVRDSGYSINSSVPANAKFTDTTYAPATTAADGLMSASDKAKLDGVAAGADVTNAASVAAAGAFMKGADTADSVADGKNKLLLTPAERTKLSGIASGAEVNQKAFSKVKVGDTVISAGAKTDTLALSAGAGITLTPGAKEVTVAETYIDTCVVSSLDAVPENLRNGGLIILKQ